MAWKNIWRNRRRTLLTLSSIAFGSTLAILITGLQDDNFAQMIDLAARLGGGHVTLQHPEYVDRPTLSRTISDIGALRQLALADPEVTRVVSRVSGQVMLQTAGQTYGAGFLALDPDQEDESTLSLLEALDEGTLFESSTDRGVILGAKLAENLDAPLGRKVVYTMTDKHGEIVQDVARVRGIIRTGAPTVDSALCLFPLDTLRAALGYGPDEVIQLGVFLRDQRTAGSVARRLGNDLGEREVAALTWGEAQPELAGFIAMKVAGAHFFSGIVWLLVAAGIFNTLFVGVMERVREFGVMLAIGFSPQRLFSLVMLESFWVGAVGLVAAALVAAGPYYYLSTTGVDISAAIDIGNVEVAGVAVTSAMKVGIYPENLVIICIAVMVATLLSGLYPAVHAGRLAPVESIRLV
jgi:ABC-type lipoprotein release transport system permease subunit